jgi:hypothetical protein
MEQNGVKKEEAKYKIGGEPVPHKSLEFHEILLDVLWPMQHFFEILRRSEKDEDRHIAEVGLSLYRDAIEKWEVIGDVVKEGLGDFNLDLLDDEEEGSVFNDPIRYLGVTITPKQEKKNG